MQNILTQTKNHILHNPEQKKNSMFKSAKYKDLVKQRRHMSESRVIAAEVGATGFMATSSQLNNYE